MLLSLGLEAGISEADLLVVMPCAVSCSVSTFFLVSYLYAAAAEAGGREKLR